MKTMHKIVLEFMEKHEDNMDVWVKTEGGEIVSIDLSRNDVPAEKPQLPPPLHLADLLNPAEKVPFIVKNAMASGLAEAGKKWNAAAMTGKPFATENEPQSLADLIEAEAKAMGEGESNE